MGLARIAIAALAVTLALGLLILGGVSLWGALTKDSGAKHAASTGPSTSPSSSVPATRQSAPAGGADGNTVVIQCLAAQCPVYVAGPGPTDVQFNSNLAQNQKRIFSGTQLTVQVYDASTVSVTINGRQQPRGKRGQQRTYRIPSQQ